MARVIAREQSSSSEFLTLASLPLLTQCIILGELGQQGSFCLEACEGTEVAPVACWVFFCSLGRLLYCFGDIAKYISLNPASCI
jgi:hypothetical protein